MAFIGRVGRPGLLGLAARSAVVAGTATAVSGAVSRRQHERAVAAQTVPAAAQAPGAPASSGGTDLVAQLQQLAVLHREGILSPEQFERAKQQLLGLSAT